MYNTFYLALFIWALGSVFGVLSIKKKRNVFGMSFLIVNGLALSLGLLVLLFIFIVIIIGELYIWKYY
ncbi:hypothetical protein [Gracilibacillus salinarum]|uniref:Amino acid transporter n=1 Tax=Gracilibacillus salinarum TaxID=2932255 RepID=A0ABY4GKH3_9BACI|nr:hypothetical protein [Gracilibacillus salinarum]UOQ84709.1 hypothetical protein MUN87_18930 [Gracilibacillus salinarum]